MRRAEQGFQIIEKFEFAIDAKALHNCMLNIMRSECRFWQKHSRKKAAFMSFGDRLNNLHGGWLALLGVLIISPDVMLIRLIKADDITATFWRLAFLTTALLLIALWRGARRGDSVVASVLPGKYELLTGMFYGGTCALFILSVRNTDAANTLVIISATPLLAGLMGVFVFKRAQPIRTWVASVVVVVALVGIVGAGFGGENALGDLLALCAAFCMAGFFNVLGARAEIDAVKAMLFGACMSTLAMVPGAHPTEVYGLDWVWLLMLGFLVLPVSFLFISAGARKIPAAEVGLIMLNEAILGSFLVWVVIHEVPSNTTLICGAVVITTLVVHSILGMRAGRRLRATAAQ